MASTPFRLFKRPVTLVIRTEGGPDANGEPTYTESVVQTVGHLAQQSTTDANGGVVATDTLRLFLPADIVPAPWDAVLVDGVQYEVQGIPWPAVNARTGTVTHVEAVVRRAE